MKLNGIPDCCLSCSYFYSEYDEYRGFDCTFCEKGLMLPTKKQSCKSQKIIENVQSHEIRR